VDRLGLERRSEKSRNNSLCNSIDAVVPRVFNEY